MGLLDNVTSPISNAILNVGNSVSNAVDNIAGIGGGGGTSTGATVANSDKYYKVTIQFSTGVGSTGFTDSIVADCPKEFDFDTAVTYESPYAELVENTVKKAGGLGDLVNGAVNFTGTKLMTQALTAKVWTGASDITLSLPLVFQAETDEDAEVLLPLMKLMFLTMPGEGSTNATGGGGFLSSPGPRFDVTSIVGDITKAAGNLSGVVDGIKNIVGGAIDSTGGAVSGIINGASGVLAPVSQSIMKAVSNPISLKIGEFLYFDNVVVESVRQSNHMLPVAGNAVNVSSGINGRVEVNVTFKTFFTQTQRNLLTMMVPAAGNPNSKSSQWLQKALKGNQ